MAGEATLAVVARNSDTGQPIANAGVILSNGQEGFANGDGYIAFQVPLGAVSASVHKPNYQPWWSGDVVVSGNYTIYADVAPKFAQITTNGRHVWRNGKRYFGKSVTFFRALERYHREGPSALRPALAQLKMLPNGGPNTVHVWASFWNIAVNAGAKPFHVDLDNAWDSVVGVSSLLAEYGMDALWTYGPDHGLFAANGLIDDDRFIEGWERFGRTLATVDNVFAINGGNEANAHAYNRIPTTRLVAPPRHLWCVSSYTDMPSSSFPLNPHGTVGMHHTKRTLEKMIKDEVKIDHPLQKAFGIPVLSDEPVRIDQALASSPLQRPENLRAAAETAYADGALYSAHSEDGKHCRVMGGYTYERVSAIYSEFDGNL